MDLGKDQKAAFSSPLRVPDSAVQCAECGAGDRLLLREAEARMASALLGSEGLGEVCESGVVRTAGAFQGPTLLSSGFWQDASVLLSLVFKVDWSARHLVPMALCSGVSPRVGG